MNLNRSIEWLFRFLLFHWSVANLRRFPDQFIKILTNLKSFKCFDTDTNQIDMFERSCFFLDEIRQNQKKIMKKSLQSQRKKKIQNKLEMCCIQSELNFR